MKNLKIIYGCMFSGKTTLLLDETIDLKPEEYLVFKPSVDTRSRSNTIRTHSNKSLLCIDVAKPIEILSHIITNTRHIFIDEIQFMDPTIISVIIKLLDSNITVCCAGLLFDARQEYFGSMNTLVKMASHKIELYANCNVCNEPATITNYLGSLDSQITIGGKDRYTALCYFCNKLNS